MPWRGWFHRWTAPRGRLPRWRGRWPRRPGRVPGGAARVQFGRRRHLAARQAGHFLQPPQAGLCLALRGLCLRQPRLRRCQRCARTQHLRRELGRVQFHQHLALLDAVVHVHQHLAHGARQLAADVDRARGLQRSRGRHIVGVIAPAPHLLGHVLRSLGGAPAASRPTRCSHAASKTSTPPTAGRRHQGAGARCPAGFTHRARQPGWQRWRFRTKKFMGFQQWIVKRAARASGVTASRRQRLGKPHGLEPRLAWDVAKRPAPSVGCAGFPAPPQSISPLA